MLFVSCGPSHEYFFWQAEVFLTNFLKVGIPIEKIHVLWLIKTPEPSEELLALQKKYNANFFYYKDNREISHYIPTTKPFLMKEHLKKFPDLNKEAIFYHDADIIFTNPIDFSKFEQDDIWYMSDTIGYIGYDYIASKGLEIVDGMAKIVGIHPRVVKNNQKNSGGGQYIIKNSDYEFWDKVEKDCNILYDYLKSTESYYVKKQEVDYPIQSWCAEMWATLWNMWYFGYQTQIHKDLDFAFSTDTVDRAKELKILHNSGVVNSTGGLFYKGNWIDKSPIGVEFDMPSENTASFIYAQSIKEVK